MTVDARYFGRAFEASRQVILPSDRYGTPRFPYAGRECVGLEEQVVQAHLDAWRAEMDR